jgi:hypothetical protein
MFFMLLTLVFQSCGRDEADLDSARLLRDVQKLPFSVPCAGQPNAVAAFPPNISKLRQHSCAERHEKHSRCKDQYHGTHTPVEELIAIEGHCRSFPPDRLYGNVILLNKNKST